MLSQTCINLFHVLNTEYIWRMRVAKELLVHIDFDSRKKEKYYGSNWGPATDWFHRLFKIADYIIYV